MSKSTHAFSLIELLVVISVLALLVALLLPNLVGVRLRARDAARKHDLSQLRNALRMYYNDFQLYPAAGGGGTIAGCGETGDAPCPNLDGSFAAGAAMYMRGLPDFAEAGIEYQQRAAGDDFLLFVALENPSDPDIAPAAARCGVPVSGSNYYLCAD